ncbi:MAG: DegV family protein [Clostridia bacterium]|nr:DegV family protein [Clostridia bacterium]
MSTVIVVDSCCDLPLEYIEKQNGLIEVIGMPVTIGETDWIDDLGKTLHHDYLYEQLSNGIMPTTAQINIYHFEETFKRLASEDKSIVYIGLSSGLSGTNNNAIVAKSEVLENFPELQIEILKSHSASIGQGILIMKAVELAKKGLSAKEIHHWLNTNELKANHWFAVDDLNHLKNGGRITSAQAAVGTLLNVKPILIVDFEGKLKPYTKVKGRKKSIKYLVDQFKEQYNEELFDQVIVGHGHAYEDAIILKNELCQWIDENKIVISELSATIASHVGPGMLALGFFGKTRAN